MDYTKNYHLPQWVKSDRIMMDDFNRMCVDIENGLTGNWQKSGELSSRIEQVAGEAREQILTSDTASQTSLKNGCCGWPTTTAICWRQWRSSRLKAVSSSNAWAGPAHSRPSAGCSTGRTLFGLPEGAQPIP